MAKVQWSETVRGSETVFSQSNQSYNKSGKSWLILILLSLQKKSIIIIYYSGINGNGLEV